MRIFREEIFGPAVTVLAVENDDEAVAIANDIENGLTAAGVITEDRARARTGPGAAHPALRTWAGRLVTTFYIFPARLVTNLGRPGSTGHDVELRDADRPGRLADRGIDRAVRRRIDKIGFLCTRG